MKVDKDKRRGIIGTTIVHIIVIISLFLIALRTPLPLPGEEGVEVNLGYTETGLGNIQPDAPPPQAQPTPPPKPQQQKPEPVVEEQEEEVLEQNIEDAPAIEEKEEEKPEEPKEEEKPEEPKEEEKPEEVVEEKVEESPVDTTFVAEEVVEEEVIPEPVVNQRALFKGNTNSSTEGSNQGIAGGIGDQGKPEGYKESNKYDGQGGKGNGPGFSLGGRGKLFLDEPNTDFKEQGTVIVDIWVDRQGNVSKAQVKAKGTDIVDPNLKRLAVDAAYNSKFEKDPTAEELQRGTITYKFVLLK